VDIDLVRHKELRRVVMHMVEHQEHLVGLHMVIGHMAVSVLHMPIVVDAVGILGDLGIDLEEEHHTDQVEDRQQEDKSHVASDLLVHPEPQLVVGWS
jgi:hypothetical protein